MFIKKDGTEYMIIIYLLRVIYENEESIHDFDSGIYEYKVSRGCLSLNLQDYSSQLKIPMANQLRLIYENEESIYDFDRQRYISES